MPRLLLPALFALLTSLPAAAQPIAPGPPMSAEARATADRLITGALADSNAYNRLAELCDLFGHRLSGSPSLEHAIDWILAGMQADGLENVHGEPVKVPHWVRGVGRAELLGVGARALHLTALGGSVATPPAGLTAEVLVVGSFDDLEAHAAEAKGRIVLFDAPFTTYGQTVAYRVRGASRAAKHGAVACLIRSVTPYSQQTPHTGVMRYDTTTARIPAAALTVEDAMLLSRIQARGTHPKVHLLLTPKMLPDAMSRNVVAEIRGSDLPNEVVALGGHIDSWDLGTGAMDDGGGCLVAWEAVRLMHRLGLRPRRTVRVVLWTNEENAARVADAYEVAHRNEHHVLAIESDIGAFRPKGFGCGGTDSACAVVASVGKLIDGIGAGAVTKGGQETDIDPLVQRGVTGLGLETMNDRYFWYHHTDADTIDKLDPGDMARCVATMAVMAYTIANRP